MSKKEYVVFKYGRWVLGGFKHSDDYQEVIRDENGVCTNIEGLRLQEEQDALKQTKFQQDQDKEETLQKLTVVTQSGKVFYADPESRQDLSDAVLHGSSGETTLWKLAKEIDGSKFVEVTFEELQEASKLALQTKGQVVGAV